MEAFMDRTPFVYKGSFARDFNDMNGAQLLSAQKIGITPVRSLEELRAVSGLERVYSTEEVVIDDLTHSYPLLIPAAKELLEEIGHRYAALLEVKKYPLYALVVTSVTRTHESVRSLQQKNQNAIQNSTHMYGTTFDISWKRFIRSNRFDPRELPPEELKHLLSSVLRQLQKEKRCYVKYERRQACFHITVRTL